MKTWILKNDLSRSPQTAIKTYTCDSNKSKREVKRNFGGKPRHYLLARKIKSRIKALTKLLTLENIADIERS